jgi:two-component system response regulator YesN
MDVWRRQIMYRIMIVDDEPIEREALILLIKNNFDNLTIVGEAQNGFEAIEMSRNVKPDIMIIDIKMPGLSGIDAIKEIKKTHQLVKFLILSSYNEFEYAQQALQLGAEDFIIKPAKILMMTNSINKIIQKLETEQNKRVDETILIKRVECIKPRVENDLVTSIISGGTKEELEKLQEFLEIDLKNVFCMLVSGKNSSHFLLTRIRNVLSEMGIMSIGAVINGIIVLFIPYEKDDQGQFATDIASYLKKILDWNNAEQIVIGIGNDYSQNKGYRHSYCEALEALQAAKSLQRGYIHINKIEAQRLTYKIDLVEWEKRFFEEILSGNLDTVTNCLDTFLNQVVLAGEDNLTIVKDEAYKVMVLLDKRFDELFGTMKLGSKFSTILEEINELSDLKVIRYWLISRFQKYIAAMNDTRNAVNVNVIVRNAIDYISREYAKNITLDDIAKKLNISPFYLSKILKKYTGTNYTDMVVDMRISNAKELLASSDFSIKEITYMSGFNSQNYFAKIFRKIVGVTPTEYRNLYYEKRKRGEDNP